ncbi:hypothetical protein JQ557_08010 [Bradyrhizobium sp. U87765 SZCCT0131]|uniref:hypothetical protein n=1 Tax=unclassified Bradyrhizobium TaxID=2631580 RepID=UPI001BA6A141|nr:MULTISPECIES: hypothetical protein [unclassified Bradyrhizobium]MBR1217929.1 hypothetical protein [Bradyrhizobium sp. U87765 SZCCT0131]MBR1261125.1 hypothetical protein [Bradyrhizobium sp. U87765 SZCCT0134]MBR1303427.1 hypothetical protein [Bradyrhizobium sp. U87765 SZCCT0110]MBR1319033.1 hypothetical protein [Bradyrhizobium sp. U87765 SZCCT0109]MBR1347358.1 hypothetical protein [Bradyrhizobium sp. U87765 SZCCT0048]
MAEADLDAVIRDIAKKQNKVLQDAVKKRHDGLMALSAKAKDKGARDRFRQLAKETRVHAAAAVRRLQISAQNAAESYARAIKRVEEETAAALKAAAEKLAQEAAAKKETAAKKAAAKAPAAKKAPAKKKPAAKAKTAAA